MDGKAFYNWFRSKGARHSKPVDSVLEYDLHVSGLYTCIGIPKNVIFGNQLQLFL